MKVACIDSVFGNSGKRVNFNIKWFSVGDVLPADVNVGELLDSGVDYNWSSEVESSNVIKNIISRRNLNYYHINGESWGSIGFAGRKTSNADAVEAVSLFKKAISPLLIDKYRDAVYENPEKGISSFGIAELSKGKIVLYSSHSGDYLMSWNKKQLFSKVYEPEVLVTELAGSAKAISQAVLNIIILANKIWGSETGFSLSEVQLYISDSGNGSNLHLGVAFPTMRDCDFVEGSKNNGQCAVFFLA